MPRLSIVKKPGAIFKKYMITRTTTNIYDNNRVNNHIWGKDGYWFTPDPWEETKPLRFHTVTAAKAEFERILAREKGENTLPSYEEVHVETYVDPEQARRAEQLRQVNAANMAAPVGIDDLPELVEDDE